MPLRLPMQFGTDLLLLLGFAGTDAHAVVAALVCPYVMPATGGGPGGPLPLLHRGSATQTIPVGDIKAVLKTARSAGDVWKWVSERMDPACRDVIYPQHLRGHQGSLRAKLFDLLKRTRNEDCHARVVKHLMQQGGVQMFVHRTGKRGNPARFIIPDPAAAGLLARARDETRGGSLLSSDLMAGIIGVLRTRNPHSGRVIAGEGGTLTVPVAAHLVRLVAIMVGIRSVHAEQAITKGNGQMFWEAATLALRAGDPRAPAIVVDAWEVVTWVKELADELETSPQMLQGLVRTPSAE